ncbi:MAG: transglutaminase-like domain-containing protein [Eubacterium sp.]|nr:transglutaminase-like domain-containing protein [Eubacterium sp.]
MCWKVGEFKYVIMYLMTTFAVIGSRRLKDDITDKRLRQKISLILAGLGLGIGLIVYIIVPPDRYERHTADITEVKNTLISLGSMDADEIFVFFKSMLKGDALSYGRVGDTASINYTGEKLMVLSGEFQRDHGMYLKGYVGGEFIDNRWRQVTTNREQYDKDLKSLKDDGLSVDDWQVALRNQIGDSQTTGNPNLWREGTLKIKNLGFGRGDYVAPYYPSTGFVTEQGKIKPHEPGLVYSEKYLAEICSTFRGELWANQYNVANEVFWKSVESNKNRLQDFVNKYYLTVPTSMDNTVKNYKDYMAKQNKLLDKYKAGFASMYQVITATKEYVMSRTDYTLSPGKTPSDVDFVEYFLDKNKKGYCEHYATATALLLRSVGIPTRYVEGAFVSKEQISDAVNSSDEVDVKDNDLHAWIEVYHPNYGFIPVETTPGRGEEESIQSGGTFDDGLPNPDADSGKDKKDNKEKKNKKDKEEEKAEMSAATATPRPEENMEFENIDTKNYNHDDGEDHSQEMDNGSGEDGQNISNSENVPKTLPLFVKIIILVVGILLAFAVAMEIQRRVRFAMYKAKLSRSRGREKILVHYRHLEKVFKADRIRYKGQSMADYAQEIASHYDCRIDDVYEMVRMTFEASFSQNDFDKSRVKEYKRMVRTMRNRIYAGRKGFAKLYLMYILDI